MTRSEVLSTPVAAAVGAPRHDYYFKNTPSAVDSILEMFSYGRYYGMEPLLRREYPDVNSKNIILNVIGGKVYVADGNRHSIALMILRPDVTFADIEKLRPGLVRVWHAGVEEGKNTPETPYDVYIPADIDISRVPGARLGMDYFKNPPAPTNIVPASFPADSPLLKDDDRGYPLFLTAVAILRERAMGWK